MEVRRYRKRPVEVDAVQVTPSNRGFVAKWSGASISEDRSDMTISTLEGDMKLEVGDYVVKGVAGEFYPVKAAIFRDTYERVTEDAPF